MAQEIQELPTVGKKALGWMAAVCVALLIAVIVLGQMWLTEQDKRLARDRELSELLLKQDLDLAAGRVGPALDRQMLPRRVVSWNGQDRAVLIIAQERGEQLGLAAGDVVLVAPRPAAPASGPR